MKGNKLFITIIFYDYYFLGVNMQVIGDQLESVERSQVDTTPKIIGAIDSFISDIENTIKTIGKFNMYKKTKY